MSTTYAEAPPVPANTVSTTPATVARPFLFLPGASWDAIGVYNHLRQVLVSGALLSKAALQELMGQPSAASYKKICDELHAAGALTTLTVRGGGRVIVYTDLDTSDLSVGDEITKSRTSTLRPAAIKYLPEGGTPSGTTSSSPITSSSSLYPEQKKTPAAQPHSPAQPGMAPAAPSGETAGQNGFSTGGDKSGENRKTRRGDYSSYGWEVVREVERRDSWLPSKPKHGKSIGYTIRMMVEDFGMAPEAARDLLIARALDSQTVAMAEIKTALTNGQTTIAVAPSPSAADAPAPVDLVDRSDARAELETTMTAAKIPSGIAAAIRSLTMDRSELLRKKNFAVHFYREARQAGVTLTDGQWWQAAQLMAAAPGWDYARISEAAGKVAAAAR